MARAIKRDPGARKTSKRATHGKPQPAGIKVGRAIERNLGVPRDARGFMVFHGGELTTAAKERALKRLGL